MKAWIVVADAASARIFEVAGLRKPLRLVEKLEHPESREKTSELVSDDRGRVEKGIGRGIHSAMEPPKPAHKVEAEHFAHQVASTLATARAKKLFSSVALVAPPHFMGLVRALLDPQVAKSVVTTLEKDFAKVDDRELHDRLSEVIHALMRALEGLHD
jgi:protein required for attachment to host cells